MKAHATTQLVARQGNPVDPQRARQDKTVVLRQLLRAAIEQSRWKHDALWRAMKLPDAAYLSKLLSGEKPLGAHHLADLPDDIEGIFAGLYAETFGQIVVTPASGEQAVKQLVSGLFGVLAPRLPTRASAMAKVTIPEEG